MKKLLIFTCMLSGALFISCDPSPRNQEAEQETDVRPITRPERGELSVSPMDEKPDFPDAILEQHAPDDRSSFPVGAVNFEYNVKNFQLTEHTGTDHAHELADSPQGQHIHLILNNRPYEALYEPRHEEELEEGRYVALSFLSRSFHMSLKHNDAYTLRQFTVGNPTAEEVDLNAPHLFYSRPKGTYVGEQETERVMLDFYVVNADLSDNGYKVRATINGEQFMLTEWRPFAIEGLPMGESVIQLEFLDENGELVESPLNPVSRRIILKETREERGVPAS